MRHVRILFLLSVVFHSNRIKLKVAALVLRGLSKFKDLPRSRAVNVESGEAPI